MKMNYFLLLVEFIDPMKYYGLLHKGKVYYFWLHVENFHKPNIISSMEKEMIKVS